MLSIVLGVDITQEYTFKFFVKKFNFASNCGSLALDSFVDSTTFGFYHDDPDVSSMSTFVNFVPFKAASDFKSQTGQFTSAGY